MISVGFASAANETKVLEESPTDEILTHPTDEILSASEEETLSATVKFSGTTFAELNTKISSLNSGDIRLKSATQVTTTTTPTQKYLF